MSVYQYFAGRLGDMEHEKYKGVLDTDDVKEAKESIEHQFRVRQTINFEQYKILRKRAKELLQPFTQEYLHIQATDVYFTDYVNPTQLNKDE